MASTGVAPTPALTSRTGPSPGWRTKVPRGAADLDQVARPHAGCAEVAAGAVRLALDADPVAGARAARTASSCAAAAAPPGRPQPHGQELAGQGGGSGGPVRVGQADRDHGRALRLDAVDPQRAETRPRRRRARRRRGRRCRVAPVRRAGRASPGTRPASRGLSAGMRSARASCSRRMPGQVEQRVDLGDGHRSGPAATLTISSPASDLALLEDPEVEAGPVVGTSSAGIRGSSIRMPTR